MGVNPIEKQLFSGFVLTPETWIAIVGALLGVGITALVYTRYLDRLGTPLAILRKQFYVNEIYDLLFVKPLRALARVIVDFFEPHIFEGMMTGAVQVTQGVAQSLQRIQSGQIRSYLAWMLIGSVVLIMYFVF